MLILGRLSCLAASRVSLCCEKAAATFAAAFRVLNVTMKMASCVKLSMDMYFKDSADKDAFMLRLKRSENV